MEEIRSMSTQPATPPPLGFKIALAAIALTVAFGLCEVGARLIYPAPPDPTRQPQLGYLIDPEIRYVNVPNTKGWIDDGFVTINALGFRGHDTAVPKPPGRYRIVTIGDSLTLGWGVNDDETFSAQLEQALHRSLVGRDIDVVNLGVGGYNTRQEVTLLERNLEKLEPDLVLVGFYSNDVPDGLDDARLPAGGTRIAAVNPTAGQVLHMNPAPSSRLERALRRSRAAYTLGRTVKRLANRGEWGSSRFSMEIDLLQGKDSPDLDAAWAGIEKQLGRLRALADSRFEVGIVVLPCREQVMGEFTQAKYQSRVRDIAGRLGFFVVDPLPALAAASAEQGDLFIPYDRNHPAAAGHQIIGEAIFQYLDEHRPAGLDANGAAASVARAVK